MRRLVPGLLALALAAGCAGDEVSESGLDEALRYFPANTTALAVVSTDLESEQFEELDAYVQRRFGRSAESFLREAVEEEELSWEDDVKPLLGGELLYGVFDAPFVSDTGEDGVLIVARAPAPGRLGRAH